ncbi:MAG: bifunctional methylenetetrahydrofolate dehydrogenase/methenyltetrahydrofolate cyclohydrolase FolD [Thermodesulfobacteriota bacterium]
MAEIIDGKLIAKQVRDEIRDEVANLQERCGIKPGLSVILVGEDPASKVYVRNKHKACKEAGIISFEHILPEETTEEYLLTLIEQNNADPAVNGILVQLPLPGHIDKDRVLEAISPAKDVDGFHPYNIGKLLTGTPLFEPCTPLGIMTLIDSTGVDIEGSDAVIVGRSNIVGKPMAFMLLKRHATVTICHSRTRDLADKVRSADIVVAAVGVLQMVKGDWIKEGAVVIDVGMNRNAEGKLAGDVDFAGAKKRAGHITPVPGGVGPMTIAMLLKNTLLSAKMSAGEL